MNRIDYLNRRDIVLKRHDGKTYKCFDPKKSISPLGYEFIEYIYDGEEYVIARIKREKDEKSCLVVRWYIEDSEYRNNANSDKICKGYPNTRGYPTWFILPDRILGDINNYMLHKR